jgi:hypothetical protein
MADVKSFASCKCAAAIWPRQLLGIARVLLICIFASQDQIETYFQHESPTLFSLADANSQQLLLGV